MKKFLLLGLVLLSVSLLAGAGCQHSGSREYIPGKGWMKN
jgi:hypothetical protein